MESGGNQSSHGAGLKRRTIVEDVAAQVLQRTHGKRSQMQILLGEKGNCGEVHGSAAASKATGHISRRVVRSFQLSFYYKFLLHFIR